MLEQISWSWLFVAAVLLYLLFDIVFILKLMFATDVGRWVQKRIKPSSTAVYHGWCLTQDVDYYLTHMNNTRIAREMDVALYNFLGVTGLFDQITNSATNGTIWKTAGNVRFRRPIALFSLFKTKTKLVYWEHNCLYVEQQLLTRDKFVRAVSLTKVGASGVNLEKLLAEYEKPALSEELNAWITSMESSSQKLRPIGAKSD